MLALVRGAHRSPSEVSTRRRRLGCDREPRGAQTMTVTLGGMEMDEDMAVSFGGTIVA